MCMEQYLANTNFDEMTKNGHSLANLVFGYLCICMVCNLCTCTVYTSLCTLFYVSRKKKTIDTEAF